VTLSEALSWLSAIDVLLIVPLFGWVIRVERELATIRAMLSNRERMISNGQG
jgi:hypothetical protein